jgi:succinate-semialdehyde dehydrogenase/glutarate-semialdehyde dehydrogenase
MIASPLLAKMQGFIGGRWLDADSRSTLPVLNPATGEHLADVPDMGEHETRNAIEAGVRALCSQASADERQHWLKSLAQALLDNKQELARIITLEHGKPLKEAVAEVEYAAGFFSYFAEQICHIQPRTLPNRIRNCTWEVHHRPAGVAGLIVPWNFPLAMLAKKLAPALAAGCSVVAKPARLTPLSSIAFWKIAEEVQLPVGVLNLVIGQANPIGNTLCAHPDVRVISFTGSTEVGQQLSLNTAPHIKRLALELGGNAPFLVFEDADVDAAADALVANKFRSAGQTCVCTNRVYVHRAVEAQFTEAVAARTRILRVGNGLDPETDIGPLINRAGFDKVAEHVRDALAREAIRLVGYDPPRPTEDWGCFYPPTVLSSVHPESLVCREETFGPLVAICTFTEEAEVLEAANGTPLGLAAYVCSRDLRRIERIIPQLKVGHVGVNTGTGPTPDAPFGGMKHSGFGREGGLEGLLEFCEPQTVVRA